MMSWEESDRTLIHLGTGGGKTLITSGIIERCLPHRSLYVADSRELTEQPVSVIQKVTGIIPAVEQADRKASLSAQIVVASAQSLTIKKRLERFPRDHFKFVIVDECHRGVSRDLEIAAYFEQAGAKTAGCTATPYRANLRDLSKYYPDIAFSMPMLNLVEEGFAPPIKVLQLPVEVDLDGVRTSKKMGEKDYNLEDLDTKISPHYEAIARLWLEHASERQTIVFCPLKKSAFEFASICRSMGITARYIAGDSPNRKEILAQFEHKEFRMLINAQVLSTGVDICTADCILSISPTHSISLYQQRLGRICRPLPGLIDHLTEKNQHEERRAIIQASDKKDALIIDLLYEHDKLGSMHAGNLFATDEDQAQRIFEKTKNKLSPQDLIELMKKTQEEKEKKLVQELERAARKTNGRVFSPNYAGILFGSPAIVNYDPISNEELKPATPKQIEFLAKFGIASTTMTKGMATKLYVELMHRLRFEMATVKQLAFLHSRQVENAHSFTKSEASARIEELIG